LATVDDPRSRAGTGPSGIDGPSDSQLIDRYLLGDQSAFAALVHRHERRVYNLAYRMLGREEDARDATQDAFLSALRSLSSFRGQAAFTTWMHRVTVNACYDILRRRSRDPAQLEPIAEADVYAAPDAASDVATAVDVQRALLQVPAEFRAVLVLHDAMDMGYEEIAEALGIPVGTVKSRLHRGRVMLGRLLPGERSGDPQPSEGTITT
jgi:RNA polymerase sigma-70 factor (ECF subfamily)